MADLLIAPMKRVGFLQANWPNVLIGVLALNWPLMMLWLAGSQFEFSPEAAIAIAITFTIALSILSFCVTRWRRQGSVAPVLMAGAMSFLVLAIVGHTARGLAIDRALDVNALTAADISSKTSGEIFRLTEARIQFETLVWRDNELFSLFPLVTHKRRDCIVQIIPKRSDNTFRTIVWGVASIRPDSEGRPDCSSHLAKTLSENLLLQRVADPFNFPPEIVDISMKSLLESNTPESLILRVINPTTLSTDLLIALLSIVLILLNAALFRLFRQETDESVPN
jgi:hypothetical protein